MLPLPWTNPKEEGCTTVAVLGARSSSFVLRFRPLAGGPRWTNGEFPEQSVAGAAQIVRCGRRKQMLKRLAIEMRSPRGVVEVVLAKSGVPFPSLRRTLLHRDPGPIAPATRHGPRPRPEPLEQRSERLERRYARQSAVSLERRWVPTRRNGTGRTAIRLEPGCHHIDVMAIQPPAASNRGVDVDIELRWVLSDELVAADQTNSADASVGVCVGSRQVARLDFAGSIPGVPVLLMQTKWALPKGLPAHWSPNARGRIAGAIRTRHLHSLPGSPVYESLGISGVTVMPIEVEPGACYLAAAGVTHGQPTALALAASTDASQVRNQSNGAPGGAVVSFCSRGAVRGLVEIEAAGSGIAWQLAVWQTGRVEGAEE